MLLAGKNTSGAIGTQYLRLRISPLLHTSRIINNIHSMKLEERLNMNEIFSTIPRFLRHPESFYESIERGKDIRSTTYALALSSVTFLIAYGFVIGLPHSIFQALSSAVKMPLLFLVTMIFCLPALYFFSLAILGTSLSILQITAIVLSGIGVTAFLLLGLSPITLFFDLTSANYPFFKLLAVVFVTISGCIGLYYLWRGMTRVDRNKELTMGKIGRTLLGTWILVYGFVGAQMTWRLSPFIGNPEVPFVLLRPSRDNFFIDVFRAVDEMIGYTPSTSDVSVKPTIPPRTESVYSRIAINFDNLPAQFTDVSLEIFTELGEILFLEDP
jgi:hypothetical protein